MLMQNVLGYSSNYSDTRSSVWVYSKDEATDFNVDIANTNNLESFKYKAKLLGHTEATGTNGILKNAAIAALLKYLINF